MRLLFLKLLSSRGVAAVANLVTSIVAVSLMPGAEYASASVAISYATVLATASYLPFSRYALICDNPRGLATLFFRAQPSMVAGVAAASVIASLMLDLLTLGLTIATVFLVIAQGTRDFLGELLRVEHRIADVSRLYIGDAITTLAISAGAVYVFRNAESLLVASAASSLCWSARFARGTAKVPHSEPSLKSVYLYAIGPVGANVLNGATLATVRTVLLSISEPGLVAAVQFTLDIAQKAMALLSSSLNSVVVPVAVRGIPLRLVTQLVFLLAGALASLIALSLVLSIAGDAGIIVPGTLPAALAVSCAVFVWSNRYKTSLMDLALVSNSKRSTWLILGAATTLAIVLGLKEIGLPPIELLLYGSFSIIFGGLVGLALALKFGLLDKRSAFVIAGAALAIPLTSMVII